MGNPMKPQWLVQGHVLTIPCDEILAAGAALGWSHVITQNFAKWLSLRSHWETLGMFSVVKSRSTLDIISGEDGLKPLPDSMTRFEVPSMGFSAWKTHLFDGEMPRFWCWHLYDDAVRSLFSMTTCFFRHLWRNKNNRETGELGGKHSMVQLVDFPVNPMGWFSHTKESMRCTDFPVSFFEV